MGGLEWVWGYDFLEVRIGGHDFLDMIIGEVGEGVMIF